MNELNIDEIIRDPRRLDSDLQKFSKDTNLLSSIKLNLITKYSKRWIAIHDGKVQADARSLTQLLATLSAANISRDEVVVRYIDRNRRRMIL